jgi:hypothetical protein
MFRKNNDVVRPLVAGNGVGRGGGVERTGGKSASIYLKIFILVV